MARETTLTGPIKTMAEAAGGVAKLAVLLGVNVTSLLRWSKGTQTPSHVMQMHVDQQAVELGVAPPFGTMPAVAAPKKKRARKAAEEAS